MFPLSCWLSTMSSFRVSYRIARSGKAQANLLQTYITGSAIFNLINDNFEKHEINWCFCLVICTDGTKSIT